MTDVSSVGSSSCISSKFLISLNPSSLPLYTSVAIKAILLLKASRHYFVVVEIHAIALLTIGGVEPLYSGAHIIIP